MPSMTPLTPPVESASPLLDVRSLSVTFALPAGRVNAVRGVSFSVGRGDVVGIVGESGCGKSVTARSVLKLIRPPGKITGGEVLFRGVDLLKMGDRALRRVRGREIAMIFQDPAKSLNPVFTIGQQLTGVMLAHQEITREDAETRAAELLADVGIAEATRRLRQYPHELSGGMRQRVMIAMALSNSPAMLIADEPTTALDVTIQAQILDLVRRINSENETAVVFISHNLGVVAELCNRLIVLYAGRVVESGTTDAVFEDPQHPYTRALLAALPKPGAGRRRLNPIGGAPPVLIGEPKGCAFAPRCPARFDRCEDDPPLTDYGLGHSAACWAAERRHLGALQASQ